MCFEDNVLLVSPPPRMCLCLGNGRSLFSKLCLPLVNEMIVVFHCTICLEERLLQTFSYAIVLGTLIFLARENFLYENLSLPENTMPIRFYVILSICFTDLFPLGSTLAFYYNRSKIKTFRSTVLTRMLEIL